MGPPLLTATAVASRDAHLAEARRAARAGARDRARALLDARLAEDPDDDEARAERARVDAWDGRYAESEAGYRAVLVRHPGDDEARAGLVDVLLWGSRFADAARELRVGLARTPASAPLLVRRARLAHWQGDATTAARYLDDARRAAPDDPEVRALRDAVFRGEARLVLRDEVFLPPGGARQFPAAELSAQQAWRHLRISARTEHSLRFGRGGDATSYNGLHSLGLAWVPSAGWRAQLELGVGAPAVAVPRWLGRVGATFPVGSRLSGSASYAYWRYDDGQVVHLVHAALGVTLLDVLNLEARCWLAYVSAPFDAGARVDDGVGSFGVRAAWRAAPRVELVGEYTYGVQLDRMPIGAQLVSIRAHLVTVAADLRVARALGLRPSVRVELRTAPGDLLPIVAPELSVYTRW